MTIAVEQIIEKLRKVDDGTLDIVKKVMREVLGKCSQDTWNDTMAEVFWQMDEINGLHK